MTRCACTHPAHLWWGHERCTKDAQDGARYCERCPHPLAEPHRGELDDWWKADWVRGPRP